MNMKNKHFHTFSKYPLKKKWETKYQNHQILKTLNKSNVALFNISDRQTECLPILSKCCKLNIGPRDLYQILMNSEIL